MKIKAAVVHEKSGRRLLEPVGRPIDEGNAAYFERSACSSNPTPPGSAMENVSTVDRSRAIQGPVRFIRGGIPHETQ